MDQITSHVTVDFSCLLQQSLETTYIKSLNTFHVFHNTLTNLKQSQENIEQKTNQNIKTNHEEIENFSHLC